MIIQSWYGRIGNTALTMRFEFYRAEDRMHRASGALTVVSVDKDSMKPRRIPEEVKAMYARFAAPATDP